MAGRAPDAPSGQPGLSNLRVTGGEGFYPAFDPDILHYAVRCGAGTELQVYAQAGLSDATLVLLHNGNTATGSVRASVSVNENHDVAIEVRGAGGKTIYVVHCIPPDFPNVHIDTHTEAVSDGLLLMTPSVRRSDKSFLAIVDNNGVPRWVMRPNVRARQFRRHTDGRFYFAERGGNGNEEIVIMNENFERTGTVTLAAPLEGEYTGGHDFRILENGNYLLMSYYPTKRDFSDVVDCTTVERCASDDGQQTDSIIQEVTPDGNAVREWNSWDHVKIEDCKVHNFPRDYAHLNSLYELDGDIVAGLRGCAQVLLLERDSFAVKWQIGGTRPMRPDRPPASTGDARFLEVVGDDAARNEFCGQHSVSATPEGTVLMFDNGTHCLGQRKDDSPFTRIVEYDISSGTAARFVREYRLPKDNVVASSGGGVTALANGNWLVTWGNNFQGEAGMVPTPFAVSEVDTDGNEIFRLRMTLDGEQYGTGSVSRERESDLAIPPNLPS